MLHFYVDMFAVTYVNTMDYKVIQCQEQLELMIHKQL